MKDVVRAMIVPFFTVLFPAVWYVNRNVTTERLPPSTEPTAELIALALGAAVSGSVLFAIVFALVWNRYVDGDDAERTAYRKRVFQPDTTALVAFFALLSVPFTWIVVEMGGVGPSWLEVVLYVALEPIGLPLLVLAPLAVRFHWAVILGVVCCVLWMAFLSAVVSDLVHGRSLPLTGK